MKFRPCIDIHNGQVKQIVGGSLLDEMDQAKENFVSKDGAEYYATQYKKLGLTGGHIILLNPATSSYYKEDIEQAKRALRTFAGGLQIGGGINETNAKQFLDYGASHVIITSYVFQNGMIHYERLKRMNALVGKKHLVLDLSCRKKDGEYYIVTDRWQNFTKEHLTKSLMEKLADSCDEFLIHAVDVEGKANGIEDNVVGLLGEFVTRPCTYAGGISSYEDIKKIKQLGKEHVDITIGSALDVFGGNLAFTQVLEMLKTPQNL